MGYDYRRSALLPNTALAVGVGVSLALDSAGLLLLYFSDADFSTTTAYHQGILNYSFRHSVSDIVGLNLLKACVLCAFWALACGRALAFATPIVAIVFCITKLAVYDSWSSSSSSSSSSRNYDHLAIVVVSLLTAPVQVLGVLRTVFTYVDPDATLAEEVEGEEEEKEQEKEEKEGLKQRAGARAERRKEKQPLLDDDNDVDDAYRLLVVGDDDDGGGQAPSLQQQQRQQQQELQQQPPNSSSSTGTTPTPKPRRRSMLYLLYRYAQPDHGLLLAGFFFIILSSLFKLAIPNFSSSLLTLIIEGATATPPTLTLHTSAFSEAMFYFILSVLGLAFFTSLRIWATAKAEVRLVARLQRILFFAIMRQDVAFYDSQGTGALTSRLTSDCTLLGSIFTTNINVALQSSINLLGSTAYLFVLNARLAGAYLALVLLFMVLTRVFGAYAKRMQRQIQSLKAEANSVADQSIALVRLVRAFAAEDWEKQRYDTRTLRNVAKELEVKMLWTVYVPLVFLLQNGLVLVVLLLGGYLVSEHGLSARSLTAFYFYSTTITEAMQSLADNVLSILTGLGAGEKIMDIISQKPTIPVKGGLIPSSSSFIAPSPSFDLRFEDVSLTYASPTSTSSSSPSSPSLPPSLARLPVLSNLHLHIKQGQRIAIVGLSGSGKSSLISLLLRFYQPTTGRILFGGHDIQTLDPRWLKAQLGVALQDPMLFGGVSIRENITYGLEGIEEKDVHQAARMAAIHEFILTLSQGYDTVVGERGVTLSGGERQSTNMSGKVLAEEETLLLLLPACLHRFCVPFCCGGGREGWMREVRKGWGTSEAHTYAHCDPVSLLPSSLTQEESGGVRELRGIHLRTLRLLPSLLPPLPSPSLLALTADDEEEAAAEEENEEAVEEEEEEELEAAAVLSCCVWWWAGGQAMSATCPEGAVQGEAMQEAREMDMRWCVCRRRW